MNKIEIATLKQSQKNFFNRGQTLSYEFRIQKLQLLDRLIRNNETQIIEALKKDLKKPETEAYVSEIAFLYDELRFTLKNLKKWMAPKKISTPITQWIAKSYLYSEPLGVVLIIAPWNYPFQLVISPLIGAIAAGNCVVIKPSEISFHTGQLIEELISKNFSKEHIAVVLGGVETSEQLLMQSWDHLFFTGGTEVGRKVMIAAAKTLTPVTLELGGKSPCLVDDEVDWQVTANRIVWGKFFNAGQTCVAPDYLLLPKGKTAKFLPHFEAAIKKFFGENPEKSPDYSRIINDSHYQRLKKYLNQGKITVGGHFTDSERYLSPTLLTEVKWEMPVMTEEIFGPILPVIEYDSLDEAILLIQSRPKPLALYFFSKNNKKTQEVVTRLSFGGGCVNDTLVHLTNPKIPFGGVGESGMGRYHGEFSFSTFSHQKGIVKRSFLIDLALRYPPYLGKLKLIKRVMK